MSTAENAISGSDAVASPAVASQRKSRSRPYAIFAVVVAVVVVAYFGLRFFLAGRENTDDAQVGADMVPISARVGGNVVAVPVVDNQAVKKGDLLAQIDPTDYENKVKVAEAEIQASKAQADAADAQMRIVEASSKGGSPPRERRSPERPRPSRAPTRRSRPRGRRSRTRRRTRKRPTRT